jgi:Fe2+ transport system protein FeoA
MQGPLPLTALRPAAAGRVVRVVRDLTGRSERLAALGVTAGASIRLLQRFPVVVFECDQTEIAVEGAMAAAILVEVDEDVRPRPSTVFRRRR